MDQQVAGQSATDTSSVFWRPVDDWTTARGRRVEIYVKATFIDSGTVEDVTSDGHILWLGYEGASPRRLYENLPTTYLRLCDTVSSG